MQTKHICVLIHIWTKDEVGAPLNRFKPFVKYFTDRSKAVLLLWIFYNFSVLCLLCLCTRLFICALWSPAGKELTSWLSFVLSNCEFFTFPLLTLVRCGTWLYWFLIFAPLFTFNDNVYFEIKAMNFRQTLSFLSLSLHVEQFDILYTSVVPPSNTSPQKLFPHR